MRKRKRAGKPALRAVATPPSLTSRCQDEPSRSRLRPAAGTNLRRGRRRAVARIRKAAGPQRRVIGLEPPNPRPRAAPSAAPLFERFGRGAFASLRLAKLSGLCRLGAFGAESRRIQRIDTRRAGCVAMSRGSRGIRGG